MQLEIGKIYEGKVTGITKFGAFVEIDKETTGMVHISEVANTFVNDINEHLKEGQAVKVKVLTIGDDKKISLSIKKALEPARPQRQEYPKRENNNSRNHNFNNNTQRNFSEKKASPPPADAFEDMLNKFKQKSEEKMSDLKRNIDGKRKSGSRRSGSKY